MATLAILDELLPVQIRERPEDIAPVDVVWTGSDLDQLRASSVALKPNVLALDLELLGPDPLVESRRLAESSGADLVLLLHRFAPRDLLREASRTGARPVKTPIRLSALRTLMTSVIVREILRDEEGGGASAAPVTPPRGLTRGPIGSSMAELPPRRFSSSQLARLSEIRSRIECECPNHLSDLLIQLNAFEEYSKACSNRDDEDARVHQMLARSTARARTIVEDALAELLVHERIVL